MDTLFKPKPISKNWFRLYQFLAFALTAMIFSSWDFSTIGFLPSDIWDRDTRPLLYGYWKTPWYYFTSFQFIYNFVPRPNVLILELLQRLMVIFSLFGLFGIFPRVSAGIIFILGTHLFGMFLPANNTMDGSATILMTLILILVLCPSHNFYTIVKKRNIKSHFDIYWPGLLLTIFLVTYYHTAALNKLLDVGFNWANLARLDLFAQVSIESSLFLTSWNSSIWFNWLLSNQNLALICSWMVLIIEVLCPVILLKPKLAPLFLYPLATMHIGIYLSHGFGYFVIPPTDILVIIFCSIYTRTTPERYT